jgi:hypothetical protein
MQDVQVSAQVRSEVEAERITAPPQGLTAAVTAHGGLSQSQVWHPVPSRMEGPTAHKTSLTRMGEAVESP